MKLVSSPPPPTSFVLEQGALLARKYRLERPAGFGGMAQLWVATNEATGAEVCVKILVPENVDDDAVQRFRREAHAAARLSHRAIVRIFDLVELGADGQDTTEKPAALAIVMELLHGETLGDYLMKKGKLPLDEAIDLALPFLSALAHAHRAGVVHRDVKPDNIFLSTDPDGHVIPKVLDFGVSKVAQAADNAARGTAPLTLEGVMLGTPSYMSPEQARGARDIDARSDVFSASIIVYMMIAGKNPFESESFHSVISAIMTREPARPADVPDVIWDVIAKGLAKDATVRYADATELGGALRRAAGRTSPTDSGVHAFASLPASTRKITVPLGGDSHVSVPPVGNAGDTASNAPPRPSRPAPVGRQRPVWIVGAVVVASAALTLVALLRSQPAASTNASSLTDAPPPSTIAARPTATTVAASPGPATTVAAPAGSLAPHDAVTLDAGAAAPKTGAAPAPTTKKPAASATALPAPTSASEGTKEPALVRDPGF